MEQLRILFVSNAKAIGGGEIYLYNLMQHFGKSTYLLCRKELRSAFDHIASLLPYWPDTPEQPGKKQRWAQRWQRFTLEISFFISRPDVVSVQSFSNDIRKLQKICKRKNIPIIYTAHTLFDTKLRTIYEGNLPVINDFDCIICVCHETKKNLKTLGITKPKMEVVYNGIDMQLFKPAKNNRKNIVWVGRVDEADKNPRLFIKIAKIAARKNLPYTFIMIGDGPLLKTLKKEVQADSLTNFVFKGYVKNSSAIYKDALALCVTSSSEAMPLTILEAMASGVPVISTKVGGIPEIITSKKEGTLVPGFSADDFIDEITALSNLKYWKTRSDKSRKRIIQQFDSKAQYNTTEQVYRSLL